jgi:hypothetical protein
MQLTAAVSEEYSRLPQKSPAVSSQTWKKKRWRRNNAVRNGDKMRMQYCYRKTRKASLKIGRYLNGQNARASSGCLFSQAATHRKLNTSATPTTTPAAGRHSSEIV